ncbi:MULTISPECIES: hypothetical protein [Luteimonas]|uniref:hypothetical protein n=1 Tax=Luteimonas TaxID=83614 RepID=UPI000C7B880C|nr:MULTISPECIES: hypothetical protein [Luteimonas]
MALSPESAIRLQTLGWACLVVLFLIGAPLLLGISPWILLLIVALGAVLAAGGRWIVQRLRHRPLARRGVLSAALVGGLLLTGLVALPLYWLVLQPALKPMVVPRVTMTDGRRELVFQGVTHIGSALFYRSMAFDLLRAREAGSVLYFEGVGDGTPEAKAWFDAAIGAGGGLNADYEKIAGFCGLHFQNEFIEFLVRDHALHPGRTVDADVSETDMYEEWRRLVARQPELAQALATKHDDDGPSGLDHVVEVLSKVGNRQQPFVGAACRGIFNIGLGRPDSPDPMNRVVLDFRNRKLAERVLADPAADLYLVYGSGHLPGFVRELRRREAAWKVFGVTWSTPIQAPEDAVGRLDIDAAALATEPL